MLFFTTDTVDGKSVRAYRGVVAAEVVIGANVLRDIAASVTDFVGGRSETYEGVLDGARKTALEILAGKARNLGADAILAMRFGYQVFGEKNGMMMVAVSGTAVTLGKSDVEIAKDEAHALNEAVDAQVRYLIDFDGRELGPFSVAQLRDLNAKGKVDGALVTRTEEGKPGPTVEQLLGPRR